MTKDQLFAAIKEKESFLCVGLDPDPSKIPTSLNSAQNPILEFNKKIIEATHKYAVAYKPNTAFYEALGARGWETLEKTQQLIPDGILTIADAKRGDIGHTSRMYARAFFEKMDFDAVTLSPYMGHDSILPYLEYKDKWAIILALTSNEGSKDFQHLDIAGDHYDFFDIEEKELYEVVIKRSMEWGSVDRIMYVVGANKVKFISKMRALAPDHFFLIPGVGAQGGSLEEVAEAGMNDHCGLLVNSSRSILYASGGEDFAEAAALSARETQSKMSEYLQKYL